MPDGEVRYARAPRVVWRHGPDRVLVRRVGGDGLDLMGIAALVWIALDEPRTVEALASELHEFGVAGPSLDEALRDLIANDLVQELT